MVGFDHHGSSVIYSRSQCAADRLRHAFVSEIDVYCLVLDLRSPQCRITGDRSHQWNRRNPCFASLLVSKGHYVVRYGMNATRIDRMKHPQEFLADCFDLPKVLWVRAK